MSIRTLGHIFHGCPGHCNTGSHTTQLVAVAINKLGRGLHIERGPFIIQTVLHPLHIQMLVWDTPVISTLYNVPKYAL